MLYKVCIFRRPSKSHSATDRTFFRISLMIFIRPALSGGVGGGGGVLPLWAVLRTLCVNGGTEPRVCIVGTIYQRMFNFTLQPPKLPAPLEQDFVVGRKIPAVTRNRIPIFSTWPVPALTESTSVTGILEIEVIYGGRSSVLFECHLCAKCLGGLGWGGMLSYRVAKVTYVPNSMSVLDLSVRLDYWVDMWALKETWRNYPFNARIKSLFATLPDKIYYRGFWILNRAFD
jgi:hypothetical protein